MVKGHSSLWSLTGHRRCHGHCRDSHRPRQGNTGVQVCSHFTSIFLRTQSIKETKGLSHYLSTLIIFSFSCKSADAEHHQSFSPSRWGMNQCWTEEKCGGSVITSPHSCRSTQTDFLELVMGVLSPEGKGDALHQGLSSLSKDDCFHDSNRHTSANPPGQAISPWDRPYWAALVWITTCHPPQPQDPCPGLSLMLTSHLPRE